MTPARQRSRRYVYRCGERVTIANADRARALFEEAFGKAENTLVLDMQDVRECDSSGLKLLIDLNRKAEAENKQLLLYRPRPVLRDLLAMTRLDAILTIIDVLDDSRC